MHSSVEPVRTPADKLIHFWVDRACASDLTQRRQQRRYPFFRAATMTTSSGRTLDSFARDISPEGIGLLHNEPLAERENVYVSVFLNEKPVQFATQIEWCRPAGHGWYASGGSFCGLHFREGASLLIETISSEVERRWRSRYPFFQTLSVSTAGTDEEGPVEFQAFSLDISLSGMGVLAKEPLAPQPIIIRTQDSAGDSVDLRARVVWCQPREHGWFVSGTEFLSLNLAELPALQS